MNAGIKPFELELQRIALDKADVRISEMSSRLVLAVSMMAYVDRPSGRAAGAKKAAENLAELARSVDELTKRINQLPRDALEAMHIVTTEHDEESRVIASKVAQLPLDARAALENDVMDLVLDAYYGSRLGPVDKALTDPDIVVLSRRIPSIEDLGQSQLPRLSMAIRSAEQLLLDAGLPADPPHDKKGLRNLTWVAGEIYEEITGVSIESRSNIKQRAPDGRLVEPFSVFLSSVFDVIGIQKGVDSQIRLFLKERRRLLGDL